MKGVPAFRQNFEDMNYYSPPSRFPMYTAYVEVVIFSYLSVFVNIEIHSYLMELMRKLTNSFFGKLMVYI